MSSIVVSGDTSGSCTLVAPAVAGSSVLTLPVATDTLVGKATTDVLTNKTLTSPVINGMASSILTSGTAQASTSGTSIDFTGIPSWVKRITVMFNGVSTNGVSLFLIQIGSGSVVTTGYQSSGSGITSGVGTATSTIGFVIGNATTAAGLHNGQAILSLLSTNTWVGNGAFYYQGNAQTNLTAGVSPALAGALDRVRITTTNGTDTFDAGSINIMYE